MRIRFGISCRKAGWAGGLLYFLSPPHLECYLCEGREQFSALLSAVCSAPCTQCVHNTWLNYYGFCYYLYQHPPDLTFKSAHWGPVRHQAGGEEDLPSGSAWGEGRPGHACPFQPGAVVPREGFLREWFGGHAITSWGNRMGGFDCQTVSLTTTINNT